MPAVAERESKAARFLRYRFGTRLGVPHELWRSAGVNGRISECVSIKQGGNAEPSVPMRDGGFFYFTYYKGEGAMQEGREFSKKDTNITKGILVILMVIHHVLDPFFVYTEEIQWRFLSRELAEPFIAFFCKQCVGGFVFLTVYGMTKAYMQCEANDKNMLKIMSVRLIKLYAAFEVIYMGNLLYRKLKDIPIKEVYISAEGKFEPVQMILDALGFAFYYKTPTMNVTWWYMALAVLVLVTVPVLYYVYKKVGLVLLPAAILVLNQTNYTTVVSTMVLAMVFADRKVFEKIDTLRFFHSKILTNVIIFLTSVLSLKVVYEYVKFFKEGWHMYPLGAIAICVLVYKFIACLPIMSTVLEFLGKHSGNIFMMHTLIYYYYYTEFIYSFAYPVRIVLVLLGCSLAVSVVLELVKKYSGYTACVNKLCNKINGIAIENKEN